VYFFFREWATRDGGYDGRFDALVSLFLYQYERVQQEYTTGTRRGQAFHKRMRPGYIRGEARGEDGSETGGETGGETSGEMGGETSGEVGGEVGAETGIEGSSKACGEAFE
jgi:hypothetical protein